MEIKDRIKEIRSKHNLTQQEFADRLGIKRNTIATYETGKSNPSDSAVVLICKEFNVNEEWLRTGNGEIFNPESTDAIDQLTAEYGLSDIANAMVKCFVNLKPEVQNEMFEFFSNVVSLVNGTPEPNTIKEHPLSEFTLEALEKFHRNHPKTPEDLESKYPPVENDRKDSETG